VTRIEEAIHYCQSAADEAYSAVIEGEVIEEQSTERPIPKPLPHDGWDESQVSPTDAETRAWYIKEREQAEEENRIALAKWEQREIRIAAGIKKRQPGKVADAKLAASYAYINNMPQLTSRGTCAAFIGCLATGIRRGYIEPDAAKNLMYSTQLALTVHRPRRRRERTTPPPTTA
jgi:hypothetical protein